MERKLAHIEEIAWIKDIPDAEKICVCGVLGWECVIKKGEFQVGEKIIYVEVDSVMPEKPEYEFLRDRKFRIRTIKLKGQVSQGLVLPIPNNLKNKNIGEDVTELLGITKYLTPTERGEYEITPKKPKSKFLKFLYNYKIFRVLFLHTKTKEKGFPSWVAKTDEERIQSIPSVLEKFKDNLVYICEKYDGQSVTFTSSTTYILKGILSKIIPIKKFKFIICSRNMVNNDKDGLYYKIAKKYNIEQILKENPTLTIQGEQADTKVQGNKYGIKEPQLLVFNIIDHTKNYHFNYEEMTKFCEKYGLKTVPVVTRIHNVKLSDIGTTVPEWVEFSKGSSIYANIPREGIVVRCIENGKKLLSFKVINPDFLLKYKD